MYTAIYKHTPTKSFLCQGCYDNAPNDIKIIFPTKYFVNHALVYGLHAMFDKCVECKRNLFAIRHYTECSHCTFGVTNMLINGEL